MSDSVIIVFVEFQFSQVRASLFISSLNKGTIGVHLSVFDSNNLRNELRGIPQEETILRISHFIVWIQVFCKNSFDITDLGLLCNSFQLRDFRTLIADKACSSLFV